MYESLPVSEVFSLLKTSHDGIGESDIEKIRAEHGFNELPEKKQSLLLLFLGQFNDIMVYILFVALSISIAAPFLEGHAVTFESFLDAIVIFAILLLNAILGFVQEFKAEKAIAELKKLTSPHTRVRRGGTEKTIPSRELLPGDIVILEAGDKISADARISQSLHLRVNESSLTGESHAVDKQVEPLEKRHHPLADQVSMVFAGTLVTSGYAECVVTATATDTEIGKIASLVSATRFPETPLQRRMQQLGTMLGAVVVVLCLIIFAVGLVEHLPFTEILLIAVSLAVSAVPEGLPAVVTVCLAMGVRRMVKEHALVRRLESLETLGSVSVICSDKTGTITENRMRVIEAWTSAESDKELLAQIGGSCNHAQLPDLGDPTEIGLLEYAKKKGAKRLPIEDEPMPFSSESKYMETVHNGRNFLKGAPEVIVELSGSAHPELEKQNAAFAERGLRVLACAVREGEAVRVIGLIAMEDPPRETVVQAMEQAKKAGIRTIMITGDNIDTAAAIARQIGMEGDAIHGRELDRMSDHELAKKIETVSVFARVSPEHKLKILNALKEKGEVVAMSGDGVNDAPALKGAHVGVAMGKAGTEVAREAASIVLADDHYATMVTAIAEGRRIYDNIKKFVVFLLRANFDELIFISTTIFMGMPIPYLPLHILWINLMTDGLPALALGMEPAEPDIMERKPRPPEEHLLHGEWGRLVFASLFGFAVTFVFYIWQLGQGIPLVEVRSATLTLAILFELCLVFSVRSKRPLWEIGFFTNRWLIGAVSIPFALQFLLLYSPLAPLFYLVPLTALEWLEVFVLALGSLAVFELMKLLPSEKQ